MASSHYYRQQQRRAFRSYPNSSDHLLDLRSGSVGVRGGRAIQSRRGNYPIPSDRGFASRSGSVVVRGGGAVQSRRNNYPIPSDRGFASRSGSVGVRGGRPIQSRRDDYQNPIDRRLDLGSGSVVENPFDRGFASRYRRVVTLCAPLGARAPESRRNDYPNPLDRDHSPEFWSRGGLLAHPSFAFPHGEGLPLTQRDKADLNNDDQLRYVLEADRVCALPNASS
jgi:hypothetical protein